MKTGLKVMYIYVNTVIVINYLTDLVYTIAIDLLYHIPIWALLIAYEFIPISIAGKEITLEGAAP